MIKNKETFLKEVALMPELIGNKISLVFALHPSIDISDKTKFVDNISTFFIDQKEEEREKINFNNGKKVDDIERWMGKDLRIKKIKLKSVKGFPDSNLPFGIDFTNNLGLPQSMIILGSNGSGKSSIYNSIEYTFCKKIGEAQLRTNRNLDDEDNEFKDYLSHFNNGFSNSMCDITTVDENFTLQGLNIPQEVRNKINPNTHFISEYDIYCNGKLNFLKGDQESFHNLIAKSLGLSELLDFEIYLNQFIAYRRTTENNKINALEKGIKGENELIDINHISLNEKKLMHFRLIESQNEQLETYNVKELQKTLSQINTINFSFKFEIQTLQKNILDFEQKYKEFITLEEKSGNFSQMQFYNLGLELLKEANECPFCNSSKKPIEEIQLYAREKIKKIESFNKTNQELSRLHNYVTENLYGLFNNIALLLGKLKNEFITIKSFSEFSELASIENSYITFIESALAEEFFQIGNGLNNNDKYKLNNNEFLFSFFENQKVYIQKKLSSFIIELSNLASKRVLLIQKIGTQLTQSFQIMTKFEQIVTLENDIALLKKKLENSEIIIKNSKIELNNIREKLAVYDAIKEDSKIYYNSFHTKLNSEVKKAFVPIKSIVEKVLKDYLENDNRNIELEIAIEPDEVDTETGEVFSEKITAYITQSDQPNQRFSVNKYFNTFRYKLFSTMVGVSIAMVTRINSKINLPLVFDDIFYASDFENRSTIENFIKDLFIIFKRHTPELELQFILFTHDQLIFQSIMHTLSFDEHNILFAKLFKHTEAERIDDFNNLVYRLPFYKPYKNKQISNLAK